VASAILYICTTCRKGSTEEPYPGAKMLDAVNALACPEGVEIRGVECLSACTNGCSVALAAPGKWTYLYGGLDPAEHAGEILRGAGLYAASADGIPPWRARPDIFRKNVIGRTPPLTNLPLES
jgi:predicted metal-binding protein